MALGSCEGDSEYAAATPDPGMRMAEYANQKTPYALNTS
jgi:hypothetical protein